MKIISCNDLSALPRFTRANIVNCLTGIKPAILIGTKSKNGRSNLAIFSSVFHLGADPALIGFVQRPLTEFSHTYKNILATNYYTMNLVTTNEVAKAHHTSAKFSDQDSEFSVCGFDETYTNGFYAPFVESSPVRFGLELVREIYIPENDTRLIIGSIKIIEVEETVLNEDGNIDLETANSVGVGGLETYYSIQHLAKFAYAKADKKPVDLSR